MEQFGRVIKVKGDKAEVEVFRASGCGGNCGSCGGCESTSLTVEAENSVNASVGQFVKIDSSTKGVMFAAFITYIIPAILLIASYAAAFYTLISKGYSKSAELIGVVVGLAVLGLYFLILKAMDKKLVKNKGLVIKIVQIIK